MRNVKYIQLRHLFQGSIKPRQTFLTHGITRKRGRDTPLRVTREELKSKKSRIKTKGTSEE